MNRGIHIAHVAAHVSGARVIIVFVVNQSVGLRKTRSSPTVNRRIDSSISGQNRFIVVRLYDVRINIIVMASDASLVTRPGEAQGGPIHTQNIIIIVLHDVL